MAAQLTPSVCERAVCERWRIGARLILIMQLLITAVFLNWGAMDADGQEGNERIWRDVTGSFSVKAALVTIGDESVELLTSDGRKISVPIRKLSGQDRIYLKRSSAPKDTKVSPDATADAIRKALAGPALPPAEIKLNDLYELLSIPVFIDERGLESVGLHKEMPVTLKAGHESLQDQLDESLEAIDCFWCNTQTVLVVSSNDSMDRFDETWIYRFPTPRMDYTSVMSRISEVQPDSWEALGGRGTICPLVPVYVITQSPTVHRKIIKSFKRHPVPHRYEHPLDLRSVTVTGKEMLLEDCLKSISQQISIPIEFSSGLSSIGLDPEGVYVSAQLTNVSAKDALDLILLQFGCTWVEEGKKLVVKHDVEAEESLSTQRIPIGFAVINGDASHFLQAAQTSVAVETWEAFGGKGQISFSPPAVCVVRQGQPAMREFEQFLRDLRSLR